MDTIAEDLDSLPDSTSLGGSASVAGSEPSFASEQKNTRPIRLLFSEVSELRARRIGAADSAEPDRMATGEKALIRLWRFEEDERSFNIFASDGDRRTDLS